MYKLGIDVGGTNTDAVLIDEELNVAAEVKFPTSEDIYGGILGAVRAVLGESGVDRSQIRQAMLGTTQCTNAIVERKNLAPVGILRIGAPATLGIRPMADWAEDIRRIAVGTAVVGGGFEYDGRELAPFDREAAAAFSLEMKEAGVRSIAISCVFSTVRNDHELEAAKLCQEIMGEDVHVSISSEIGSMGLIERENAAILNAALWQVAGRFTDGFAESLEEEGIAGADVYLSQNDGTLMTMEHARRYPILTVACGPTNSIRGASYLSRLKALVFGGDVMTATDIAVRLGMADLGDPALVADIPLELAEKALAAVCVLLEDSIDAMKVSNGDIDVILVGGGSIIVPEQLAGAARVVKPEHFGCANAIGSAISKVSGTYEKLMDYDEIPRERALEQARAEAVEAAVKAGAVRETVEIIEVEDVPLAYYPGNTNRVKVKAAGDLRMERRMTKSGNCETDK